MFAIKYSHLISHNNYEFSHTLVVCVCAHARNVWIMKYAVHIKREKIVMLFQKKRVYS